MAPDWNLVGKSWTAQYDKDMMIAELSGRFREGFQLRKPTGVVAQKDISPAGCACEGTSARYQGIDTDITENGDTFRKWRCRYEGWQIRRNDLGWKTKKTILRKKNMGESTNGSVHRCSAPNRFHALSCDAEDNFHAESEIAEDPESPPMLRTSARSRHQHSSENVASGRDRVQRRKKSGVRSKVAAARIATKKRAKGGSTFEVSGRPQMYMFKQVPQGFGDTWRDSDNREESRAAYGGEVIEWMPPKNYEDWYDRNRPKPGAIADSVANSLRKNKVDGKILLVGDSAAAYCVDRKGHVSFATLQRQIRRRVSGVKYLSLRPSSGAKYVDFLRQIKEAAIGSSVLLDSLVLLGGWNDGASPSNIYVA